MEKADHTDDGEFARLIDEFTRRCDDGELIDVEGYASEYSNWTEALRSVLPAVVAMRSARRTSVSGSEYPALVGEYQIVREIARGGMGIVLEAIHRRMDRRVALKLMPPGSSGDVRRFEREVRLLGKLRHPNVAIAYDAGSFGPFHYLAMEYLEGRDLRRLIDETGPVSPKRAVEVTVVAAKALAHAHDFGIVHRDVKPSNLFIERDGNVKLLDLGLACLMPEVRRDLHATDDVTMPGHIIGTPDYVAPEQIRDPKSVDCRTDVFGLGCSLYFMLTGRPRFSRSKPADAWTLDHEREAMVLDSLERNFGSELKRLIERMTAVLPDDRFSTMQETADALNGFTGQSLWDTHHESPATVTDDASRTLDLAPVASGPVTEPTVASQAGQTSQKVIWGVVTCLALFVTAIASVIASRGRQSNQSDAKPSALSLTDASGMRFVYIPAGTFMMGSDPSEIRDLQEAWQGTPRGYQLASETPMHSLHLTRGFYLAVYEVTVGQFREFVEATNYKSTAEESKVGGMGWDAQNQVRAMGPQFSWRNPGWEQTDRHPVVNVSWHDAVRFCQWKSTLEGVTYRLPTEAEWEYACRRGRNEVQVSKFANISDRSFGELNPAAEVADWTDEFPFTAPVGSFTADAQGVFDLIGNTWEWCSDWHGPYDASGQVDPIGAITGTQRTCRGGSWNSMSVDARATARTGAAKPENCSYGIGFRVVREAQAEVAISAR